MSKTLQELIDVIIEEELNEGFRGFNLKLFKKFIDENLKKGIEYAKKHLPFMGQGSTRAVFAIGKGKVLKISFDDDFGPEQNQNEIELYKKLGSNELVTKIYDYDKTMEPAWIISDAVKIIGQHTELQKLFKADYVFFNTVSHSADWYSRKIKNAQEAIEFAVKENENLTSVNDLTKHDIELAEKIYFLAKKHGLEDITNLDQWGLSTAGNIVLADYGIF